MTKKKRVRIGSVVTIEHSLFIVWDQFNMRRVNCQPTSFPQQIDGHNIEHHMLDVINFHFKWKLRNKENICKCFSSLTTRTIFLMPHDNAFSSVTSPTSKSKAMTAVNG